MDLPGDGAVGRGLLFLLATLTLSGSAGASCIEPSTLVRSTASLTRHFSDEQRREAPAILGIRGTGWFLSRQSIVTAAHVAEAMRLSPAEWTEIELGEEDSRHLVSARILRVAGSLAEKMAVLELKAPLTGVAILPVRAEPLAPEERLVSLAYPDGKLRFAGGRFAEYGADDRLKGLALIEMHDGNDRLVLDHGASGAPVLDCAGRVAAVVSTLLTRTIALPTGEVRVSTAWQTPNVLSIPAGPLNGAGSAE
jgi:trypsin-like peptidase